MADRIFGARLGAGVQVIERQPVQPIADGPLGSTLLIGAFRSGPTDRVVELASGEPQYRRIYGGLMDVDVSQAPLAAEHFFDKARGAGRLFVLRVDDDAGERAVLNLYSRDVDRSVIEQSEAAKLPGVAARIEAHNAGRWAGRQAVAAGDVSLGSAILTTTTINLGITPPKNAWKGAILRFPNDDSSYEGVVVSNTAAGVFTMAGPFPADLSSGSDGRWTLELTNVNELTGDPEALAVVVEDGGRFPASQFSLRVLRDGGQVKAWSDLDLDPDGTNYWLDAINGDLDNYELEPSTDFAGDPALALSRPANFAEIPAPGGVATEVLHLQVVRWQRTGTGNYYLDTVNDLTWGADPRPVVITLTFTGATTFSVAAVFEGSGIQVAALPNGTVGVAYASQHAWLPGFTVRAGGTAAIAGDTMVLTVRPLPSGLASREAYLYAAASQDEGNVRHRWRIVANDHDSVTVQSGSDLTSDIVAPGAPTLLGTGEGPFDLSAGSLTFTYSIAGQGPYTLTSSLSGGAETAAATAADLNARELARVSAVAADKKVLFEAEGDQVRVRALQDFGPGASLVLGNGTINTELGFTNGQSATGADPTIVRLQWRQELGAGIDGLADLTAARVAAMLDPLSSPLNDLIESNTGVIKLAAPGWTDPVVQAALALWAYTHNAVAYLEIPAAQELETSAVAWHEANLAFGVSQDYCACHWPTYGDVRSPYGAGLLRVSLNGLILGAEARYAVDSNGYHLAPAGRALALSPTVVRLPTGDRPLDQELLNAYGLIETRKRGSQIYPWGDRIVGFAGRPWKHKRIALSHIGRVLLTNTEFLVWSPINAYTFATVKRLLRGLFRPWFAAGWFDDSRGPGFDDQVSIKVDETNNPVEQRDLGNMHAEAGFEIVNTSERVIFAIGPRGVAEKG